MDLRQLQKGLLRKGGDKELNDPPIVTSLVTRAEIAAGK